jgi:hypothetical protein
MRPARYSPSRAIWGPTCGNMSSGAALPPVELAQAAPLLPAQPPQAPRDRWPGNLCRRLQHPPRKVAHPVRGTPVAGDRSWSPRSARETGDVLVPNHSLIGRHKVHCLYQSGPRRHQGLPTGDQTANRTDERSEVIGGTKGLQDRGEAPAHRAGQLRGPRGSSASRTRRRPGVRWNIGLFVATLLTTT